MADPVATAFVRIRPTAVGFQQEATQQIGVAVAGVQRQVTSAGRGAGAAAGEFEHFNRGLLLTEARALGLKSVLGGVSAFFIGGAGLATLFHTAAAEFANFTTVGATTNAIIEATGGAAHVTAAGVQALATALEHKTGIDDEQIKSAENVLLTFRAVRNEAGLQNDVFDRATKGAVNLSRVFGTDVPSTARQLGRALQDPTRGLLTLRRAGLTFTASQTKVIKSLADTGQLLKAQTLILAEVDRRVGGTAEAVGRTLPGQLNILKERAKDALGDYVKRLSESHDAAEAAATGGAALAAGFGAIEATVRTLGPGLVETAKAARAVEGAIGAGPIIAAVVGYKALGVGVTLATKAKGLYARASVIAAGSTAAEAGSAVAATAALRAETVALTGVTVATRGYITASGLAVIQNDRVAVSATRSAFATRAAAAGAGASRLALAAVGGPIGAVAIGAAALAAGFFLVRRAAENAAGGIIAARHSLDDFNASAKAMQAIHIRITGAREAIAQAQSVREAASAALTDAERRQQRSTAPAGSLEQRALANQVTTAREQLARATGALAREEGRLAAAQSDQEQHQRDQPAVISATTQRILDQIEAVRARAISQSNVQFGVGMISDPDPDSRAARTLQHFIDLTEQLRTSGTRADRVVGGALERIADTVHRLPTQKEIKIVLTAAAQGRSVDNIIVGLGIGRATENLLNAAASARERAAASLGSENTALQEQYAAAQKILRTEEKTLATRKEAANTARAAAASAREAVTNAIDTLTSANESLVSAQQALADSITAGQNAVTAAVRDAKTNLRSIADSIAEAIGRAADQGATKIGPAGPLAKKFQQLRDQILRGQGGPETQRAAQEVAARLQAQAGTGDDTAERAKRRLDDLSDSFARGRIGAGQFNAGVQRILHDFGLNLATFGKTFGSAALQDLQDQIRAARQQAQAIAAGPQRPGGGGEPNIVRPLEAVRQAERDTRDATKSVERATRDVARAQRELGQKQLAEERAHTKELKLIRQAVQAQLRVTRQKDKLTKPKPNGKAGKDANDTTTAGASRP